jgi:hypothetical protein
MSGNLRWSHADQRRRRPPVIVPMGLSMHLTAIGSERRRSIVIILHRSSQLPTTMVHDRSPKGLCKGATDLNVSNFHLPKALRVSIST